MDEANIIRGAEQLADTLLGPIEAELLEGIRETGSIAAAGRRSGMSYKTAWYQVHTLNGALRKPLVIATRGGKTGGRALLTPAGAAILDGYRRREAVRAFAIKLHRSASKAAPAG